MTERLIPLILTCLFVLGCGQARQDLSVPFAVQYDGAPIDCTMASDGLQLTDLRLFVSDIRAVSDNGHEVPVELVPDGVWQQQNVALVDLEDGSGSCENGTPAQNATLRGSLPEGQYTSLRFTVGVPFDQNHLDPLLAAAPLDDAAMHWHWRGGYKFMRAGVRSESDGFWLHLGSTGCEGKIGNITGCGAPNRVNVELPEFDVELDSIAVDLARLMQATDLHDGIARDCSSGPAEIACEGPFDALGLAGSQQQVFVRRAGQ